MNRKKLIRGLLIIGVVAVAVTASISASAGVCYESAEVKKAAVLPFADYSHKMRFITALKWGGNERIVHEVAKALLINGVAVAEQEAVNRYLRSKGIIKRMKYTENFGSPEHELIHAPHGRDFTKVLFTKVKARQEDTAPLSRAKIMELGREWGVDAIFRGAILQYELPGRLARDPFQGIIPFPIPEDEKIAPGYAYAVAYEKDVYKPQGAVAVHDYNIHFPEDELPSSIIVVIYAQDTKTGNVIWAENFELPYSEPNFSFKLKKNVAAAFKNFFVEPNYGYLYRKE